MSTGFDMCVDYDTLCEVQEKLKKIQYDLSNSTEQMVKAINSSQDFLAGNQFEKAKNTTAACLQISSRTGNNIQHAMEYLEKLKNTMDEYGRCSYDGEA
ncbi:hypothetical protein [Pseudobutyrivibrio sp. MD2005]|uniref:hypothetical protein n=1 Tax=Pseudobutyrivibrio sp. MD2005 TaxID=1410616 RepID=UPI000483BD00|nr:hypothetical protein [Pseudobutyrivibrio sp. MD2005]